MTEKTTSKTENKPLNIYQKINAVMKGGSFIDKEKTNNKAPYPSVSHDAVTAKLNELMVAHGIVMISNIVELIQDSNRTQVKMEVSFVNIDDPSDKITVFYYGHGVDNQDKGIGKAVSYAIKYCLLKTFMLQSGTKDDVESHNIDYKPAVANASYITQAQYDYLDSLVNGYTDLRNKILQKCNGNFYNLSPENYALSIDWANKKISAMGDVHA